jgi:hypothetical protein
MDQPVHIKAAHQVHQRDRFAQNRSSAVADQRLGTPWLHIFIDQFVSFLAHRDRSPHCARNTKKKRLTQFRGRACVNRGVGVIKLENRDSANHVFASPPMHNYAEPGAMSGKSLPNLGLSGGDQSLGLR